MIQRFSVWEGDLVRVETYAGDFDKPTVLEIEKFVVAETPSGPGDAYRSQGNQFYSPIEPFTYAYVEQPTSVPWRDGFVLEAGLVESAYAKLKSKAEQRIFSGAEPIVTLKPALEAGKWKVIEHQNLLASKGGISKAELDEKTLKVDLSQVHEGRIHAAPVSFLLWVAKECEGFIEEVPDVFSEGREAVQKYQQMSVREKIQTHVRQHMYFGAGNGESFYFNIDRSIS